MNNIAYKILALKTCKSTNDEAKKWLKELINPEGLVITSHSQTAGKGMANNQWITQPGKNLLCSIVISPKLHLKNAFILNCLTALVIHNILKKYINQPIAIKWPNDILVNQKKIAGILIENLSIENQIKHSVIGIGLNVNQTEFEDENFNRKATSILNESKTKINLDKILNDLLLELNKILGIMQNNPIVIYQKYIELLYLMDQSSFFEINGEKIKLTIRGIGNDGALITEDLKGNRRKFETKEIKFLE